MNKIIACAVIALPIFLSAAPEPISENQHIKIPVVCEMIHERMYLILRLEKLINLLKIAEKKGLKPFHELPLSLFDHERIKRIADHINTTHTLSEYFNIWRELTEFRHIKDKELGRDFTKLNLALLKQLSLHSYAKKIDFDTIYRQENDLSEIVFSLDTLSFTEALTVRSYYTNRLKKAVDLLATMQCKNDSAFESNPRDMDCMCAFDSHYTFKNKDIIKCITSINQSGDLKSVIALTKDFSKCKLIQDNTFTREFILFIFCIYKNLIHNNATLHHATLTKSTAQVIAHLYENLENLPLEEILDALDMLSEELPKLLEQYEFTSTMQWRTWLAKYWWVPPVIGSGLIIKIWIKVHLKPSTNT